MKIDKVFIATWKYDWELAKRCIASVRYWYPDIEVVLIKDNSAGSFNTKLVEKKWRLKLWDSGERSFGWGYSKLEPLFDKTPYHFLILDADTVLIGPVIDEVKDIDADFVVDKEVQPKWRFNEIYYDLDKTKTIFPDFVYPGYSFNTGQWFGTTAILKRKDFNEILNWSNPRQTKYTNIFNNGEQGHLNFVVHEKENAGQIKVDRVPLCILADTTKANSVRLDKIKSRAGNHPSILHWAGMTGMHLKSFDQLSRYDILAFYEKFYYSRMSKGSQFIDGLRSRWLYYERKIRYKMKQLVNREVSRARNKNTQTFELATTFNNFRFQLLIFVFCRQNLTAKVARRIIALTFFFRSKIGVAELGEMMRPMRKSESIYLMNKMIVTFFGFEKLYLNNVVTLNSNLFYTRAEDINSGNFFNTLSTVYFHDQYHAGDLLKEDSVVIDAGANLGLFSLLACQKVTKGQVYAFEPVKRTFNLLEKNGKNIKNFYPIRKGLGDRSGHKKIGISNESSACNSIIDSGFYQKFSKTFFKKELIEIITVDEFVEKNGLSKVDFIKIDTEGYERQVIRGAVKTIKKYKPVIAVSAYHLADDKKEIPKMIKQIDHNYKHKLSARGEEDLIFFQD